MSVFTARSNSGFPVLDSVATMVATDLQVGDTVVTEAYISTWAGSNLEPAGGGTYQIVTEANYLAITGNAFVDNVIDHTLTNGGVAMLSRDGLKNNAQGNVAANQGQTVAGLNVNLEDWNSAYNALEIGGNSSIFAQKSSAASNSIYIGQNLYVDSGGAFEYQETDEASHYLQSSGIHRFSSAPSGTAGTTPSMQTVGVFGLSSNGANALSVGKLAIEAWGSQWVPLQVGGNGSIVGKQTVGSGNALYNFANMYHDGSDFRYISTDEASYSVQQNAYSAFFAAASGTAGNTITFTEISRMGLSTNGAEVLSVGKSSFAATSSSHSALQVGGNTILMADENEGAGKSSFLFQNAYFDGVNYKYISTDEASLYRCTSGEHRWSTAASGTAGTTITWVETMRTGLSSNGAEVLSVGKNGFEDWKADWSAIQLGGNASLMSQQPQGAGKGIYLQHNIYVDASSEKYISTDEATQYYQASGAHIWNAGASGTAGNTITWSEVMRTDVSGNFMVGKAAVSLTTEGVDIYSNGAIATIVNGAPGIYVNRLTNDGKLVSFQQDSVEEGSISITGATTSYNTTSDYRIKENVVPLDDGLEKLKLLKPSRFNFKVNPDNIVDGFIAHEVQEVLPMAVIGEKDAVDEDGEIIKQQMDASKLIPLMVAAMQEMSEKVDALEAELTLLKA